MEAQQHGNPDDIPRVCLSSHAVYSYLLLPNLISANPDAQFAYMYSRSLSTALHLLYKYLLPTFTQVDFVQTAIFSLD